MPVLYLDQSVDVIGRPAGYGEQKIRKNLDDDYHQVTDTVKADWDLGGAAENAELLYAIGAELAAGAPYPTWKKGSEFKAIREATPH